MPHSIGFIRPGGSALLERVDMDEVQFNDLVASVVADALHTVTGEFLEIGQQSLTYDLIHSTSMPVKLAVVVVMWWTQERADARHDSFAVIQASIEEGIRARLGERQQIEVHLVVIGQPGRP